MALAPCLASGTNEGLGSLLATPSGQDNGSTLRSDTHFHHLQPADPPQTSEAMDQQVRLQHTDEHV
jgi:hypothetical protein